MTERGRLWAEWTALMVLVLGAVLLTHAFLVAPYVVAGPSMSPTLLPGDYVLVDRWTYRARPPRAGEVVLLEPPGGPALVKRVAPPRAPQAPGSVRVIGDNATSSRDSRQFGPVPAGQIRGRVVCRYWPPSRAGLVR